MKSIPRVIYLGLVRQKMKELVARAEEAARQGKIVKLQGEKTK